MKVKIKKLSALAEMPKRQTSLASGFDLHAAFDSPRWLHPGERMYVPTGLALEIPEGYEGQVRPRSGLSSKHGIMAAFGTIDADYRGEVGVTLYNHSFMLFKIEPGMRVAQIVFTPVVYCDLEEVESLTETERGTKGFGSTGK